MTAAMKSYGATVGVIDIFAGPGGLGEGFSHFAPSPGVHPFSVAVSAEMEASAHATLQLRAFVRSVVRQAGSTPREYNDYLEKVASGVRACPAEFFGSSRWKLHWQAAEREALNLTLGTSSDNELLYKRIADVRRNYDELVLIGGPPCQAYSVVGRVKQANVKGFKTKGVPKHFLYRQYLRILADFEPAVFIMENVRGILTSTVGGRAMFKAITADLANPVAALNGSESRVGNSGRYVLLPIHINVGHERTADLITEHPERFVIRCEDHGVPQARHRVIIMGVRRDMMHAGVARLPGLVHQSDAVAIDDALAGLPRLRSGLSRRHDDAAEWREAVEHERSRLARSLHTRLPDVSARLKKLKPSYGLQRRSTRYGAEMSAFAKSMHDPEQAVVLNHEARGHMQSDLGRYLFCAAFALERSYSPTANDFPWQVAPNHSNWGTGMFADRFRVQLRNRPSTTVTSHLSKDGHAFIHWDPRQCRSLTVREAARLQTFPDNYLFLGNRTQQYVQVGNAVPPLVAQQIAGVVWHVINGSQLKNTEQTAPHPEARACRASGTHRGKTSAEGIGTR